MACSKLFSGDLPEISTYIIQNLRNNFSTLYSLVLVNRFWCRLAIPLLWEDPFSIKYRETLSFHFLDIYFLFLSDKDKSTTKFHSKFNSNLHEPLFNYPSLIKTLNTFRIRLHIANWINSADSAYRQLSNKRSYFPLTLTNHYEFQISGINEKSKFACITLFKLFIENNASLNNLRMSVDDCYSYKSFYDICDKILNNPKFISKIE